MNLDLLHDLTHPNNMVATVDIKVLPRRCALTNRWLWQEPAIRLSRSITVSGPGGPVHVEHWVDPKEYTLFLLKHGK